MESDEQGQTSARGVITVTILADGKVDISPPSFHIKRGNSLRWHVKDIPSGFEEVVINPIWPVFPGRVSGKPTPPNNWCDIDATADGFSPKFPDQRLAVSYTISLMPRLTDSSADGASLMLKWPPDGELVIDKCGPPPNP